MFLKLLSKLIPLKKSPSTEEKSYAAYKQGRTTGRLPTPDHPYVLPILIGCLDHNLRTCYNDKEAYVKNYNRVLTRLNKLGIDTTRPIEWMIVIEPVIIGYKITGFHSPIALKVTQKAMDRRGYFLTH